MFPLSSPPQELEYSIGQMIRRPKRHQIDEEVESEQLMAV